MKTNLVVKGFALIALVGSTFFTSCKKDKEEESDKDTASAVDQALATTLVNDMTNISDEAGRTYTVSSFKMTQPDGLLAASCASVTIDTLSATKTLTVNFGTANCLCNDYRYRRGALVISFTGRYRDSSAVITVTPNNYYVNDNQITGNKTIINKGHNSNNHLVYEINANVQIVKANNGGTISWQSIRQREWVNGESTLSWLDDVYSITGNASGTSSNGNSFTSSITSPLIRNMSVGCRKHFISGVLVHTPGGKASRTIDFGNGTCDDQATVTINGVVYNVTLP